MTRINYWASYYMPLILSSKPHASVITTLNLFAVIIIAYLGSQLFFAQYNDPSMFRPNSQDYFRTSLLGFLSPILLCFFKTFILNLTSTSSFSFLNMLVDYPFSDWFMLLIVVSLAYPQQEVHEELGGDHDNDLVWHIIPKQSYIFGLSWALSEIALTILLAVSLFEETTDSEYNATKAYESKYLLDCLQKEELASMRKTISLSKCVDVRRQSSKISDNIYQANINRTSGITELGYGTFPHGVNADDQDEEEDVVVVAFSTDSMNFLKDLEGCNRMRINDPNFKTMYNPLGNASDTMFFSKIHSWKFFWQKVLIADVIILCHLLDTIGQALISSIYFIYVPGHDKLFTKPVIYFGERRFLLFLLVVVGPLSTANFLYHSFLFFWKDEPMEEPHESSLSRRESHMKSTLSSPNPTNLYMVSSDPDTFLVVDSTYTQNSLNETDEVNRILALSRNIIHRWRLLASNRWFLVSGTALWSTLIFLTGVLTTNKQLIMS
ncbi:Ait1p Ecym_8040 [Eremothecium cymbalariae DBVPG|uniref:Transmembrane protein n=1 Tax=Eremothecium cymbalariae (strain CBS 270.75 / DBVPG 7215 / KCTC 17166 / NRRL Y-17582) TaxID=931890 RepID=G8JWW2_ERECY|nr:Hypothetical protein Ecym_8040 [Eremothecium cymbalariae DBVPG\